MSARNLVADQHEGLRHRHYHHDDRASPCSLGAHKPATPLSPLASEPSLRSTLQSCTAQLAYDLFPYESLPAWLKDNPYISHGYRVEIGWRNSCHSMCHLHNETMNIWTHFIAFLMMLVLMIVTLAVMSPFGHDRIDLDLVQLTTRGGIAIVAQSVSPNICPLPPIAVTRPSGNNDALSLDDMSIGNCSVPDPHIAAHWTFIQSLESYLPRSSQVSEVIDRLHSHLPNIQRLTLALKQQALSLPMAPAQSFLDYVDRVEQHIQSLRKALTFRSEQTLESALELKQLISSNIAGFLQHVTMKNQVDMMRVAKSMIDEFVRSTAHTLTNTNTETDTETGASSDSACDDSRAVGQKVADNNYIDSITITQSSTHKLTSKPEGLIVKARRLFGLGTGSLRAMLASSFDSDSLHDLQLHFYLTRWPVAVFMVSALLCLLFSATFHCFSAVSEHWSNVFQCLDYCGITLLIAGSNVPILFYGFYCQPMLAYGYIGLVTSLGVVCFATIVLPSLRDVKYRSLKTALFISLGFSGIVPLCHMILSMGYVHFVVYYLLMMGGWYLIGAMLYLFHWPERFWPGKFNVWFASHQLWHVCIVIAVLTHYVGVIQFYEWRMTNVCPI